MLPLITFSQIIYVCILQQLQRLYRVLVRHSVQEINCNYIVNTNCLFIVCICICRISSGTVLSATPTPSINTGMHVTHK